MLTTGEKWTLGIIITIIGGGILYFVGVGQGWWRNIFVPNEDTPAPPAEKTNYQKCIDSNNTLPDNAPCEICMEEGRPSQGIIRDGRCIEKPSVQSQTSNAKVYKLKVKSPAGAYAYSWENGNFVAKQGSVTFPVNSEILAVQYVNNPAPYYRTMEGYWIDAKDVTFLG